MRRLIAVPVAIALALTVAGLALVPLASPWFTAQLASRFSEASAAGLTTPQAIVLAQKARAFVVDYAAPDLAVSADGRTGFDAAAVSHLRDVRGVIDGAQLVTGLLAAALTLWLGVELARGRLDDVVRGLRAGAIACVVIVGLALIASFANFDAFFAWFHSLFFSAGTWEFPADSLLIRLFPEPFWMLAGGAWAALVLLGGLVLWLAAGAVAQTAENRAKAISDVSGS